jgi:hypothetical protein
LDIIKEGTLTQSAGVLLSKVYGLSYQGNCQAMRVLRGVSLQQDVQTDERVLAKRLSKLGEA